MTMGEITLKNGKVIKIDASNLTVSEWRKFTGAFGSVKDENAVISKCTGLTVEEIEDLNYQSDFIPIVKAIVKAAREPLADPNSQSAST